VKLPWSRRRTDDSPSRDGDQPQTTSEETEVDAPEESPGPPRLANDVGTAVARSAAPAPDDPRKPRSPTQMHPTAWRYVLGRTVREAGADQLTDLAATLTYYAALALAPALIALLSLLSIVGQSQRAVDAMLQIGADLAPPAALDQVQTVVDQVTTRPAAGLGFALGLLGALWSASAYVGAFGRAMNRIYEIDEGRPMWKLRPVVLLVTFVSLALMALVALGLVVSGPVAEAVGRAIGLGEAAITTWNILRWPIVLGVVILVVAILYYATPNVRQPHFRWVSVGATVAIVVWVVASMLFGLYVSRFGSYDATYGSLAGIIVFLLWLWISNLALLLGAEIDAELERGRQLQAGIAAEEAIQLPPRDTTASRKRQEKAVRDIVDGRELREAAAAGTLD
jgi:membrane protein